MNRQEHLLVRAMEECAEVAQRISKALVFGMEERQPGQALSNHERIRLEFRDLVAVLDMCDPKLTAYSGEEFEEKVAKVERYLVHSRACGTLADEARGVEDADNLRHMLGVSERTPDGYRNYFVAGDADVASMERLRAAGLVVRNDRYLPGDGSCYNATVDGARFVGLRGLPL